MLLIIFWIPLALLLYAFVGYPLLVKMLSLVVSRRHAIDESLLPPVSVVLSVYNEEAVIREKIENFLLLDYPPELLEFVIVSDQCADRTEEIISSFDCSRIRLLVQEKRSGKTLNLNRGVAQARGEVVIFTDANSMFDRGAVRKLVRHFADPRVGLVSGRSIYLDSSNGSEELGGAYRKYEEMIKEAESAVTSIVGADGAIYALRRSLYEPLRPEYINDFIHTIQAVLQGHRAISDPGAICREVVDESYDGELRRQTRIMAQSWLIYLSQIGKLLAGGKLRYAWALTSHKFLRWLTLPLMVALIAANAFLLGEGLIYQALFAVQAVFIFFALLGGRLNSGIMRVPYMFTLLHAAAVLGLYAYLTGNVYTIWSPRNS